MSAKVTDEKDLGQGQITRSQQALAVLSLFRHVKE